MIKSKFNSYIYSFLHHVTVFIRNIKLLFYRIVIATMWFRRFVLFIFIWIARIFRDKYRHINNNTDYSNKNWISWDLWKRKKCLLHAKLYYCIYGSFYVIINMTVLEIWTLSLFLSRHMYSVYLCINYSDK